MFAAAVAAGMLAFGDAIESQNIVGYQDITIPFQMSSKEFFQLVSDHLTDDGVMVVNLNMKSNTPGNINEYLADTIASVFPNIYTADVVGCSNRILYASHNDAITENLINSTITQPDDDLYYMFSLAEAGLKKYVPGKHVMTDDKAPVELLGMSVIDELISDDSENDDEVIDDEDDEAEFDEEDDDDDEEDENN